MATKTFDLQSALDNAEQLADLQRKAIAKSRGISLSKTFAANPDIRVRMAKKLKATLAADPNILKKAQIKRLATIAADPDIMKRRAATYQATLATNPEIIEKRSARRADPDIMKRISEAISAGKAKKRDPHRKLHTPYGIFTARCEAIRALVNQDGFTKNKSSTGNKINLLIKTNPKEWYWVKKD
jgi:hypothetical protein